MEGCNIVEQTKYKVYYNATTLEIYIEPIFSDNSQAHLDDPYFLLTDKEWFEQLSAVDVNIKKKYIDNQIVDEIISQDVVDAKLTNTQINKLTQWFDEYDMQVRQYERAIRLNLNIDIHIDDKIYNTINDLDSDAQENAKELKRLKELLITLNNN